MLIIVILISAFSFPSGKDSSSNSNIQFENSILFQKYIDSKSTGLAFNYVLELHANRKLLTDIATYLNDLCDLSTIYLDKGFPDSALIVISLTDSLELNIGDSGPNRTCNISYIKGLCYYQMRIWKEAENYFEKSLIEAKVAESDSIIALSLKSLGNIKFVLREYKSSLILYKQSLNIVDGIGQHSEILKSSIYQNLGISYSMLNNNDSALFFLYKSVKLKELYLAIGDPILASGYLNISRLLQLNGDLKEALEFITKAELIYLNQRNDISRHLGPLYFNKGSILLSINDYEEALHYHELALEEYKRNYEVTNEIFPQLYLNFGFIFYNLARIDDAIMYFSQSLTGNISTEQRVKGHLFLGLSFMEKQNYIEAKENFKISLRNTQKYLGEGNIQTANVYLNYGSFCDKYDGREEDPLLYYFKAAEIYKSIFGLKNRDLSIAFTQIGNYYLVNNSYDISLEYFHKALISFIPDFSDTNYLINPNIDLLYPDLDLFYILYGKSQAFIMSYLSTNTKDKERELRTGLHSAQLAINLLERIKSTLQGENTKLLINSRASEIYDLAVIASAELYKLTGDNSYLESSFTISEKSKAAILLSTMKESEALQIGNLPEDILQTEKQLKRSIAQYQNLIYEENQKNPLDSNKVSKLRNRLFQSKLQYDSLVTSLENDFPEYYNLKYNFDVVSISEIQKRIKKDEVFIEYKLTDSTLFIFIIKCDTASLITKNVGTEFDEKVNDYLALINQFPKTDSVRDRSFMFAQLGVELTNILNLNDPLVSDCEKLIIIPDGILGYLSFDALISDYPAKEKSSYNKLNYLIYKHSISYGYSGTLIYNRDAKKPGKKKVLAFAPSYDQVGENMKLSSNTGIRDLEKYLIPLPYTRDEVMAISKIFEGEQYIGEDATESEFKSNVKDYAILHFAMHTLINDEDPLASKLVFALTKDTLNDGFLNTYEIYNLDLEAELAVLSACRTGAGNLSKGEGIMSLARGFLYAGVPGIVMTLWAVEDISGAQVISGFYQNLFDGQNKDVALQNAKLQYINNADALHAHPYFWAAYVQIGDSSPISNKSLNIYFYSASIGVFLILLVILIVRWKKKPTGPLNK